MIKAIIVDDELHGRENLRKIIDTYCSEITISGTAGSVVEAKILVEQHRPDVVFLDINMPILDGFDFLEEFESRSFNVVFVSAHEEYGIKAVKAGAIDYLLKPINIKELMQTVKKLMPLRKENAAGTGKVIIPASHGFNVALVDDIIRLEADGCYTKVITNDGKNTVVSRTLKDFEDSFPKSKFFRVHKSHLINLMYIKEYSNKNGYTIMMSDGSRIEISRRRVPDFIQLMKSVLNAI